MASVANINDVLEGHVTLEIECVDRLYLNAYVPRLQVGGQIVRFLRDHLGHPIPSPALLGPIGNRFRREVKAFAEEREIPVLHLKKPDRSRWDDRKLDHVHPYLEAAEREGRYGVVAIVACQEFQWVFSARNRAGPGKVVSFEYFREERRVGIRTIQESKNACTCSGPKVSQTACSRSGRSQLANPLDSAVNAIPARAAWRLAHSCPLSQTFAEYGA